MSLQSRATSTESTTFPSCDDGGSGNFCSGASSVADIARAANLEYSLHKIESESSATSSTIHADRLNGSDAGASSRKRSSARISLSPENQPFLTSYGSAFLSGIFADIAEASEDQPQHGPAAAKYGSVHAADIADDGSSEPCHKKARSTPSTSFGRQPKSYTALAGLAEGAISEIQDFNDQVRELQDMAFPSLPQIPITVSSSSCSAASVHGAAPRRSAMGENVDSDGQDSPSYGWFVSTDADETDASDDFPKATTPTFLPSTEPSLAFKALTAPEAGDQDLVVQQALAADTIDDVLGDLF